MSLNKLQTDDPRKAKAVRHVGRLIAEAYDKITGVNQGETHE